MADCFRRYGAVEVEVKEVDENAKKASRRQGGARKFYHGCVLPSWTTIHEASPHQVAHAEAYGRAHVSLIPVALNVLHTLA